MIELSTLTADQQEFGQDVWVYCDQHLRPHKTGWCTVANRNKTLLQSASEADAYAECEARGFKLYNSQEK